MKFQVMSDTHIEHYSNSQKDISHYVKPVANNMILTGDIGSLYKTQQLLQFLKDVCSLFENVFYIAGNHEYYTEVGHKPLRMDILRKTLHEFGNVIPNLHILDKSYVEMDDIIIAGCTLWSYPQCNIPKHLLRIYKFGKKDYINEHLTDLDFIFEMVQLCKDNGKKLVLATHYGPTKDIMPERWINTRYESLYYNKLDDLLNTDNVSTWIYGHTHHNMDFVTEGGTRVVSNQHGKLKDRCSKTFSKEFVVEF